MVFGDQNGMQGVVGMLYMMEKAGLMTEVNSITKDPSASTKTIALLE